MLFDLSSLPINGRFVLACALYAGASLLAGQVVGTRTIERSGWPARCEAGLKAEIAAQRTPEPFLPQTDCRAVFGWLHPDVNRLCHQVGNPDLGGPAAQAAREAERRRREFREAQLTRAAAAASSHCACAAAVYVRETVIPLGVYAGTARAIALAPVADMQSELAGALRVPACARLTEGGR